MSLNEESKSKAQVTLEDLLRLKRSERPDAAFWQDFERGMRHKQLAAIIEPRPWWLGLSILSRKIGPLGMPISAGAAAMLALVVMRVSPVGGLTQTFSTSSPEPVAVAIAAPSASTAIAAPKTSPVTVVPDPVAAIPLPETATQEPQVVSEVIVKPDLPALLNPAPSPVANGAATASARVASSLAAEFAETVVAKKAPESSSLASSRSQEPSSQALGSAASALEQGIPESNTSLFALTGDELQSDKAGLNPRQARLLSSATEVTEGKSLASVRERVLHRLVDDEARYAAISRVGVNADRLSLKF